MPRLTKRQRDVLAFIAVRIQGGWGAPTTREMCDHFGWSSTQAAYDFLEALEAKGMLESGAGGKARARKLTEAGWLDLGFSRCPCCQSLVEPGKAVA